MRIYKIADQLYQSGMVDQWGSSFYDRDGRVPIDAIVDLIAGEHDREVLFRATEGGHDTIYVCWSIDDGRLPDPDTILDIAKLTASLIDRGRHVLVHCIQGWNRSGLIVATTLILRGATPEEAIRQVRKGRGTPHALGNEAFERWLLMDCPVAPEAALRRDWEGDTGDLGSPIWAGTAYEGLRWVENFGLGARKFAKRVDRP